jgi:hypothetical protein
MDQGELELAQKHRLSRRQGIIRVILHRGEISQDEYQADMGSHRSGVRASPNLSWRNSERLIAKKCKVGSLADWHPGMATAMRLVALTGIPAEGYPGPQRRAY